MATQRNPTDQQQTIEQAEEEVTDPRLLLDDEGDAAPAEDGAKAAGDSAAPGNQVIRNGESAKPASTTVQAGAPPASLEGTLGRDEPHGDGGGPRDGGYGANRDRERGAHEPGDFAPDADMQQRDPVAAGGDLSSIPRPAAGQPTGAGTENTWRDRGGDERVADESGRQRNLRHDAPPKPTRGERVEKSAAIDVGTDETSGDR